MKELRFISDEQLNKENIKNIVHAINNLVVDSIIDTPKDQINATHYTLKDGSHAYTFDFNRRINSDEADNIMGGLYSTFEFDFIVEIEADIEDPETEKNKEFGEYSPVVEHSKWFLENMKEGWSYGMRFDESQKKNPYLRPYHKLTERQRKILEKSKEKLGKYGLDEDFIAEMRLKEQKEKVFKEERKKALNEDTDVIVEYNEHHNAFCAMGDNTGFCYCHDKDKNTAEEKSQKVRRYMEKRKKKPKKSK